MRMLKRAHILIIAIMNMQHGIKKIDSLHLACAIKANADQFLRLFLNMADQVWATTYKISSIVEIKKLRNLALARVAQCWIAYYSIT